MNLSEILLEFGFSFLSRSGKVSPESGCFRIIWKILAKIWLFLSRFGFFGFWGRETETDPLESASSGEDLAPTAGVVGLADIGSNPVGSSDGFEQPYSEVSAESKIILYCFFFSK